MGARRVTDLPPVASRDPARRPGSERPARLTGLLDREGLMYPFDGFGAVPDLPWTTHAEMEPGTG